MARSAYREAVAAFEQALQAVPYLPDDHKTHAQAIDLRLALREALYPLGEPERLLVSLQEAEGLAEALGDPHRTGWIAVDLLAHFGQAGELDRARAAGQRALTMAAALGEVGLTVAAQYYLGHIYHGLGAYRQAIACMRQNVACLHGTLRWERFGLHGLLAVHSRSQLVCYLAECGAFAEGRGLAEEAVQIAETAQHPYSRVMAYWGMGVRTLCQGEIPQAIVVFERALQLVQEAHLRLLAPKVTAALGAAYALIGRTAEALLLLHQAMTQGVAMGYLWDHALRTVWLGEAYLRAGHADEASTQAQRALEFARTHQQRGYEAYALRLLGESTAQREPPEATQAATHYQHALALAEELGLRPLAAHCHRGLGILYATTGQQEQARAALTTAIAMYRATDMAFWLPETKAALAHVEGR